MQEKDVLTPKEVAQILGMSLRRVRRLIAEGKLPVADLGPRTKRVHRRTLEDWLVGKAAYSEVA
jgi:excisionase family DNA binding protein